MENARILLEVVAGLIPNQPLPEYTKQWAITSAQWYREGKYEKNPEQAEMEIMQVQGLCQEYMRMLWNPQKVNWVQCNWIYL